jgi:hypothetical protein
VKGDPAKNSQAVPYSVVGKAAPHSTDCHLGYTEAGQSVLGHDLVRWVGQAVEGAGRRRSGSPGAQIPPRG